MDTEIGPVEFIVLGFPGNRFKGEIVPALADLVESETIRIIDLAFVKKDADGSITTIELEDVDEDEAGGIGAHGDVGDLLTPKISSVPRRRSSRTTQPPCSSGRTRGRRGSPRRSAAPTGSCSRTCGSRTMSSRPPSRPRTARSEGCEGDEDPD